MVNGHRLKHYKGGEVERLITMITLSDYSSRVKLYDIKWVLPGRQLSILNSEFYYVFLVLRD